MSLCDCPECQERERVANRDHERFVEGVISAIVFAGTLTLICWWLFR